MQNTGSNRGINQTNNATNRYAFVSPETYHIRLSLLPGYDNARYVLNHLMKKYRSTNEVIFVNLYTQNKKVGPFLEYNEIKIILKLLFPPQIMKML
jgi:hypothetical protein